MRYMATNYVLLSNIWAFLQYVFLKKHFMTAPNRPNMPSRAAQAVEQETA